MGGGAAHARLAAVAAGRGRADEAARLLAVAADELAGAGVALVAAAVRLRLAAVRGEPLEASPAWAALADAGVRRPDRWMAMYAPWPAG
ncbi:MAG: hypothetical protein H6708_01965 [Kofleriaceae bacterium]|nr:hypothetical protein [Kofleriaceae bacterium]